ncbi:hypothetical protein S40285_10311 [Stachybotrys chlorohalonatus IBT 40285]|uniref:Uncharacterized protein n=1 Tax=Stachybotrys chlorohalonatus (strain IBT 40285) TaxID=1283841 RepID=A0A084QYN4_STAC4|nr:hypothetical protein S40285_10311 [Stachybotrys chlorohalonata IBT 40285]
MMPSVIAPSDAIEMNSQGDAIPHLPPLALIHVKDTGLGHDQATRETLLPFLIAGDRRLRTQYTPVLGGPQKSLEMQMGREHTTAPAALTDDPADVVPVMDADYTDRVSELTPLPCISREIRGNWSKLLMR